MAGPELTPELLEQLEKDAEGFPGRWESRFDDASDSIHYIDKEGEVHEIAPDIEIDDVADPIVRMLNAAPALVAAAKERDQLNAEVAKLRRDRPLLVHEVSQLSEMLSESQIARADLGDQIDQLRTEVERLESRQQVHLAQIAKLSQSTPLAEELAGWESQRAKMIAEVGTLRAEVERLRAAAPPTIPISAEAEAMVDGPMQEAKRAEIERKP
jgi:chromosome segregation ATPase